MQRANREHKRELARKLRRRATPAERAVWALVRDRRLLGLKFRRQHPIRGFIVDFYCAELGLVLEIDGAIHHDPQRCAYDTERSAVLEGLGLRVARLANDECTEDSLRRLLATLETSTTSPSPGPRERGQG